MTNNADFYESLEAKQLAQAYQEGIGKDKNYDWLFLICLFLAVNI